MLNQSLNMTDLNEKSKHLKFQNQNFSVQKKRNKINNKIK